MQPVRAVRYATWCSSVVLRRSSALTLPNQNWSCTLKRRVSRVVHQAGIEPELRGNSSDAQFRYFRYFKFLTGRRRDDIDDRGIFRDRGRPDVSADPGGGE